MSLRARLLLAFAYVLVLVIVALEVPLALNLSKRVDAEVKSEAQGQAQLLAAGASGRLGDRDQLQALAGTERARAATTPADPRSPGRSTAAPHKGSGAATTSMRTSSSPRSRSWSRACRRARCG